MSAGKRLKSMYCSFASTLAGCTKQWSGARVKRNYDKRLNQHQPHVVGTEREAADYDNRKSGHQPHVGGTTLPPARWSYTRSWFSPHRIVTVGEQPFPFRKARQGQRSGRNISTVEYDGQMSEISCPLHAKKENLAQYETE